MWLAGQSYCVECGCKGSHFFGLLTRIYVACERNYSVPDTWELALQGSAGIDSSRLFLWVLWQLSLWSQYSSRIWSLATQ